jgi:hypothetical protein
MRATDLSMTPGSDDAAASRAQRASSFASVADEYERGRPGYPREAIEWLLGASHWTCSTSARAPAS